MVTSPSVDRDLVVEITRDLVRFPTVNPPGDELPAAQYLAGRMEELGLEAELQECEPNRANVIGRLRGEGDGHFVLSGHIDVVPPGGQAWQQDPFAGTIQDGRIYGRGSTDMKGGVAAIITALATLKRSGFRPRGDLIAAITYGEEAGMVGAGKMVERRSLDGSKYLLIAEPTGLSVLIAERGVLWVRVKALGRTAHGSMPHLGANAVSAMARLLPRLEAYPFPFKESLLLGKPTLSANVISGGNKTNVVPDYCEVELDMRLVQGQDPKQIQEQIRQITDQVAAEFGQGIRFEIEEMMVMPAVETDREEPLIQTTIAAVQAMTGKEPTVSGVPYGTDAAYLGPGFDIPMVICGPGEAGMAHQPDETVEISQLTDAVRIYTDLARRLVG